MGDKGMGYYRDEAMQQVQVQVPPDAQPGAQIQALVGVPPSERTQIPRTHETKQEECSKVHACFYKEADKNVTRTPRMLQRVCDTFASDFACLGYKRPSACVSPRLEKPPPCGK